MKYFSIKKIAAMKCEYNIIYGGRASGKSYQMATYLLDDFINNGHQFVRLLRSWGQGKGLDSYFQEIIDNDPDKYAGVTVELSQDKGFRYTCNGEVMGYVIPLSLEHNYKSNQYPGVVNVIFEEFVAPTPLDYLDGDAEAELRAFKSVLSTIFRHRKGRVWLVGNSINTSNPYFEFFGIDGSELKVGDRKKYVREIKVKGKSVPAASVAVEYVPIGYTDPAEVPIMMRLPDNEIAITGAIEESEHVTDRIHRVFSEYGNAIGMIVDRVDFSPLFSWTWKDHYYYILQTYAGELFITEAGNPCNDVQDIALEIMQPEPPGMIMFFDSDTMESPDVVQFTGVKVKELYFDSAATEFHFSTDVAAYHKQQDYLQRFGFAGGADTSTATGREQQRKFAQESPDYVIDDIYNRDEYRRRTNRH